ncbi:MAG: RNA pseudouridine synthase, partial [Parcubacteria group bacterium]|nr:RNA pseudouridine synthase [Parcubacteria group bacterium]
GRGITAARTAVTTYRVLERFNDWSLLRVRPKTGRMHQIRVHLASIGHPIAGDSVYGGGRAALPGLGRQFLHAFSLAFSFPPGRRWHFEAALPEDLDRVLRDLRRLRRNA